MTETKQVEALVKIQSALKAPKNQVNTFGKYKYRSCEDILEAVKPLCAEHGALLTISDDIVEVGGKLFVKATAVFQHDGKARSVTAYAMHALTKKSMDDSQITGATSSYARKYALNGLFLIDDTKDSDATNTGDNANKNVKTVSENQAAELAALISEVGTDESKFLKWAGAESVEKVAASKFAEAIKLLERKRK